MAEIAGFWNWLRGLLLGTEKGGSLRRAPRIIEEEGMVRELYTDDFFDLFVWRHPTGQIVQFQLCYEKGGQERAFTWKTGDVFTHVKVDTGKQQRDMTPIFVSDGILDEERIAQELERRGSRLDPQLIGFIKGRLNAFGKLDS